MFRKFSRLYYKCKLAYLGSLYMSLENRITECEERLYSQENRVLLHKLTCKSHNLMRRILVCREKYKSYK